MQELLTFERGYALRAVESVDLSAMRLWPLWSYRPRDSSSGAELSIDSWDYFGRKQFD